MTDIPKILIVGYLRSGKTEVSNYLRSKYGFQQFDFGNKLKYYADQVFSLTPKPSGKPRALYQQFGEKCREIDPLIWVRHAEFSVKIALDMRSTRGIVIGDGRQPHEVEWARENDFIVVRVTAPEDLRLERAKQAGDVFSHADLIHDTEQHVDSFAVDYEIHNDGTIDELRAQVDAIITDMLAKRGSVN